MMLTDILRDTYAPEDEMRENEVWIYYIEEIERGPLIGIPDNSR